MFFDRGYDCAMIGHTQLFIWPRYSDIISLLTITVQGVSNKHCLLPFFHSICTSQIILNQADTLLTPFSPLILVLFMAYFMHLSFLISLLLFFFAISSNKCDHHILPLTSLASKYRGIDKQCRPRSDAA